MEATQTHCLVNQFQLSTFSFHFHLQWAVIYFWLLQTHCQTESVRHILNTTIFQVIRVTSAAISKADDTSTHNKSTYSSLYCRSSHAQAICGVAFCWKGQSPLSFFFSGQCYQKLYTVNKLTQSCAMSHHIRVHKTVNTNWVHLHPHNQQLLLIDVVVTCSKLVCPPGEVNSNIKSHCNIFWFAQLLKIIIIAHSLASKCYQLLTLSVCSLVLGL